MLQRDVAVLSAHTGGVEQHARNGPPGHLGIDDLVNDTDLYRPCDTARNDLVLSSKLKFDLGTSIVGHLG